ncbi:MAG TPA: hypothetical protein DDY31_16005 [Lachnospiraceae bacterium]|nr:hypothetical protein [Lachnospiraceae bacterium]
MKANDNFILRNIGDIYFILPADRTTFLSAEQMLTINETGAYLWNCLQKDRTLEDLASDLQKYYQIDCETAYEDTKNFLATLQKLHAITA